MSNLLLLSYLPRRHCHVLAMNPEPRRVSVGTGSGATSRSMCQILVADHPRNPDLRRERLEFGCPVVIRANVWIGGGPSSCQELRLEMMPLSVQEALSHVV